MLLYKPVKPLVSSELLRKHYGEKVIILIDEYDVPLAKANEKGYYDRMVDNIWSVLFTTGYLTQRRKPDGDVFNLVIPNMEIRKIFTGQIMKLFKDHVKKDGEALNAFCEH